MPTPSDSTVHDSDRSVSRDPALAKTARDKHGDHPDRDSHLALLYETPGEQFAAVVPFVRRGLEANDRVVYIADERKVSDLTEAFAGDGIDVASALNSGALTVCSTADDPQAERVDPDELAELVTETAQTVAESDEYDRLRVTSEMTWAADSDDPRDRLAAYERRLDDRRAGDELVALCQYNRARFADDVLDDVVASHPQRVYDGTVTQNFTGTAPSEFVCDGGNSGTVGAAETHFDRIRAQEELADLQQRVATLASSSERLVDGDTETVTSRLTETVQAVLAPTVTALFWYDEAADELTQRARSGAAAVGEALSPRADCWALLRAAFAAGESEVFTDRRFEIGGGIDGPVRSGVVVPLGRFGVLFVGSTAADAFERTDVDFATTAAAVARATLERAEQADKVERQNERLRHLTRINRTIRRIDQALVQASTREEVETLVCERLVETEPYVFAWVGDRDPLTDRFVPRQWAGEGGAYLDGTYAEGSDDAVATPARQALDTGEVVAVPNVLMATFESWRQAALDAGFQSAISVPLVYDDAEYGTVNVYSATPNVFMEMEQEVLAELGSTVAYTIDAVETRASLHVDRVTTVSLRVTDDASHLLRFARRVNGRLGLETVLPEGDERLRLFFTVTDADPEDVRAAAEESVTVETLRQITAGPDEALFEALVRVDGSVFSTLGGFDASVVHLTATPDAVELEVALPQTADVRGFVDAFSETHPGTAVQSVQRVTRPSRTKQSFYADVESRLTDRQLEALQLAYHSGYFEWPRESTGEDVAESLGVTQPTFTGHLRTSQRKLFELLFGE